MRKRLLLPLCLLTGFGCDGTYVLGTVIGSGGSGNSSSGSGNSNSGSGHGNPGSSGSGNPTGANGGDAANVGGGSNAGAGGHYPAAGSGAVGPQFACDQVGSQQFDPAHMQAYSVTPQVSANVNETLKAMGQDAKALQMMGVPVGAMDYYDLERGPHVEVPGVGTLRGYNFRDGNHGVNLEAGQKNSPTDGKDFSTAFPTPSIRAASWDLDLEKRVGEAIGDETAASLNNILLAPNVDIIRHPYWGRTQEAYGEDTYQIGRMATAFTVGLQEYVTGCAAHFAADNIEKNRSSQDALMNEQTLREIYGRPFEMIVQDGGVGCVMAAYNKVNGLKSTQNQHLLRDILKGPVSAGGFGFQGFVVSDWWAMPGDQTVPPPSDAQRLTTEAVNAGLDVEMPWTLHYDTTTLGKTDQALVEDAARRVLTQKFRFKTVRTTDGWSVKPPVSTMIGHSIDSADHQALAEEIAIHSAVLVQNGTGDAPPVLPLKDTAKNIAVIGPEETFSLVSSSVPKSCVGTPQRGPCTYHFATDPALGDRGSARVNGDPEKSIGPFKGIQDAADSSRTVTNGNSPTAAAGADTIVVVVGYTPGDEGEEYPVNEGGDRHTLDLPPGQNDFVTATLDLMKPTIIVIESGSIVNLPWLKHANKNQATVWAGYGGMRGGSALGKLLFAVNGANFSGKVPLAWPTQAELDQAAFKDNDPAGTRMGYFFGYREYDRRKAAGATPNLVFPFGHGLSYSHFDYSNLVLPCQTVTKEAIIDVTVDIQNTSAVDGDEVALLFVKPPAKPAGVTADRPVKELKSFARVSVPAGQKVTAQLPLRIRDLRRWEGGANGTWRIDSGVYTILVGKNADDAEDSSTAGTLTVQAD